MAINSAFIGTLFNKKMITRTYGNCQLKTCLNRDFMEISTRDFLKQKGWHWSNFEQQQVFAKFAMSFFSFGTE